jgi:hypothetical protein
LKSGKNLFEFRFKADKLDRLNRLPGMQDNVERPTQRGEAPLYGGPQAAPYPIPLHRTPQDFAYCETNAGTLAIVAEPVEGRNVARKIFSAFLVHSLKIRMFQQSRASGELLSILFLVVVHILACTQWRESLQAGYSRNPGFTETRLRPLARRRDSTACPLFVFIRVRKPCVLERWRRLG